MLLFHWFTMDSEPISRYPQYHQLLRPLICCSAVQDADVAIYINVAAAMKSGIDFVQSSNGVILTVGSTTGHGSWMFLVPQIRHG